MKIVLIGDSSVGKSALVHRFLHNKPLHDSKATVGIAFFKQAVVDPETNEEYTLQIWDTAGQEKFQSVTTHHYRAADGALLVFDISNEQSFNSLDKWLQELRENTDPTVMVALVGTKGDLYQQRVITEQMAMAYASANQLMYVETSAHWDKHRGSSGGKDHVIGVEHIYIKLIRAIVHQQRELGKNPSRLDISSYYESGGRVQLGDRGSRRSSSSSSRCSC
jgi:small GTP-binding protein